MKVIVSGAGVAGPTVAFFLAQSGHDVVLVERAASFRDGGYIIDFWGHGVEVAKKLGVWEDVQARALTVDELTLVDENNARVGGFPFAAVREAIEFCSLPRGDLARVVFERTCKLPNVKVLFGTSITEIQDATLGQWEAPESAGGAVRVTLSSGEVMEVDLVVGADGLHSNVRRLTFPPVAECTNHAQADKPHFCAQPLMPLGLVVAAATVPSFGVESGTNAYSSYAEPGRSVSWYKYEDGHAVLLFVFVDESLQEVPSELEDKRALLASFFEGVGGGGAEALRCALECDALYVDGVAQTRLSQWHRGRTVLVGDACACPSLLAGEGTSLGMLEGYVLAGEIAELGVQRLDEAIGNYERILIEHTAKQQVSAAGNAGMFAPKTWLGLKLRNWGSRLLGIGFIQRWILGSMLSSDLSLKEYAFAPPSGNPSEEECAQGAEGEELSRAESDSAPSSA